MKVLLVRPNYHSHIVTPPLGIGYLSAYLKKNGIKTKIIDALREELNNEALLRRIIFEKPDVVGITCLTAFYKEVVDLSNKVNANNIRCIIGGVHPTFLPYDTLRDSKADFIICGEGEIALLELIKNGFNHKNIPGVLSRENLEEKEKPIQKAQRIENLDDLPFPDWEELNPNLYSKAPHGAFVENFPIGTIMTSRGCPHACTYCASPAFYDRKIRFRSPENVIKEIKYLIDQFQVKEIHFEDDNLTLRREHIEQICNLIIEGGLNISWMCPNGIRADKVDEPLIKLMKRSGCYNIVFGIESVNPRILKNVKKEVKIDTIKESIDIVARNGISCQGFFIFGLPGETKETIEENIRFAKKTKLTRAVFLMLDILPGSEMWDELKGKFEPKWDKISYKEPEWIPEGLTKSYLMQAQTRAYRSFYLRPTIFFRLARSIRLKQIQFLLKQLRDYRLVP